jgi:two-component system cell cycle response regulator
MKDFLILLVDDEPDLLINLEAAISREGYSILTADDGPKALEIVKSRRPNLVLLDVMMPGMDGFEVCKKIKEDPETNGTAVIFLSADKLTESKVQGFEAGAFDYVEKPFSYAEIFARLRAFRREWMYRREILSLIEFSRKTTALDFDRLMETFKQEVGKIFYADRFSIFLWKKETRTFKLAVSNREFAGHMGEISEDDTPLMRDVVESGEIIFIRDIRQSKYQVRTTGVYVDNYAFGIPLKMEDKTIGVLNLNGNSAGFFDDHDLSFMRLGAELMARAISNALQYKTIQEIAITDPLTGIYNRRHFFERLRNEFERARRYKTDMTIIMADLDHFKRINDNYGHETGDKVLVSTAEILKKHLRKIDLVARYGGEEFILLLPEISKDKAYNVAERIRKDLESQAHDLGGVKFYVTVSMGVADTKSHGVTTVEDLIRRADEYLYHAKNSGRNVVVV